MRLVELVSGCFCIGRIAFCHWNVRHILFICVFLSARYARGMGIVFLGLQSVEIRQRRAEIIIFQPPMAMISIDLSNGPATSVQLPVQLKATQITSPIANVS